MLLIRRYQYPAPIFSSIRHGNKQGEGLEKAEAEDQVEHSLPMY
jgi:hypothetical protein